MQIGAWEAEERDEGTCWRCQAEQKNLSKEQRERIRPGVDKASLCIGLDYITVGERKQRVEQGGRCWFCNAEAGCDACEADPETIGRGIDALVKAEEGGKKRPRWTGFKDMSKQPKGKGKERGHGNKRIKLEQLQARRVRDEDEESEYSYPDPVITPQWKPASNAIPSKAVGFASGSGTQHAYKPGGTSAAVNVATTSGIPENVIDPRLMATSGPVQTKSAQPAAMQTQGQVIPPGWYNVHSQQGQRVGAQPTSTYGQVKVNHSNPGVVIGSGSTGNSQQFKQQGASRPVQKVPQNQQMKRSAKQLYQAQNPIQASQPQPSPQQERSDCPAQQTFQAQNTPHLGTKPEHQAQQQRGQKRKGFGAAFAQQMQQNIQQTQLIQLQQAIPSVQHGQIGEGKAASIQNQQGNAQQGQLLRGQVNHPASTQKNVPPTPRAQGLQSNIQRGQQPQGQQSNSTEAQQVQVQANAKTPKPVQGQQTRPNSGQEVEQKAQRTQQDPSQRLGNQMGTRSEEDPKVKLGQQHSSQVAQQGRVSQRNPKTKQGHNFQAPKQNIGSSSTQRAQQGQDILATRPNRKRKPSQSSPPTQENQTAQTQVQSSQPGQNTATGLSQNSQQQQIVQGPEQSSVPDVAVQKAPQSNVRATAQVSPTIQAQDKAQNSSTEQQNIQNKSVQETQSDIHKSQTDIGSQAQVQPQIQAAEPTSISTDPNLTSLDSLPFPELTDLEIDNMLQDFHNSSAGDGFSFFDQTQGYDAFDKWDTYGFGGYNAEVGEGEVFGGGGADGEEGEMFVNPLDVLHFKGMYGDGEV